MGRLKDSLGRVNSRDLTRDFFNQKPADAKAWVQARNIPLFGEKAIETLRQLYDEAGWLGWCVSRALVSEARKRQKADAPELSADVDWEGWEPGDARAAGYLIRSRSTPGLKSLIDRRDVTIKGIEQTRYDQLGAILGLGVAQGDSMDTVASNISAYLRTDMAWAETVARTETRAAVTAASVDFYRTAEVTQVEWLTAWDEACEICQGFEDLGPVELLFGFDGLDGPPGHPNCLCVVMPVLEREARADYVFDDEGDTWYDDDDVDDSDYDQDDDWDDLLPDQAYEVDVEEYAPQVSMPYDLQPTELQPGWDDLTEGFEMYGGYRDVAESELRSAFEQVAEQDIQIAIRTEALAEVLDEGRLKSVFEVPEVKGESYVDWRRNIETNSIGIPETAPDEVRPIYGAIHNTENLGGYGEIRLMLNDDVKERSSMCVGDSFSQQNPVMISDVQNGTASTDDLARAVGTANDFMFKDYINGKDFYEQKDVLYWEVQIHGGVNASDIATIRMPKRFEGWDPLLTPDHPLSRVLEGAAARGIPVTYE